MTAVARCKPVLKLSVPALLALAGSGCGKSIVNSPHPTPALRERYDEGFYDATRPIACRFDVANLGDGTARNLQLVYQLPKGVQVAGASGATVEENGTLTWPLGAVEPGGRRNEFQRRRQETGRVGPLLPGPGLLRR